MIKLREWATIRAALQFWQEEMCPSGSTIMQPYYDVEVEESLVVEEITALREKLSDSYVRYAVYDPAIGRLASIELIADVDEAGRQRGTASMVATVVIPTQRNPNSNKLKTDEARSSPRPTFNVYNSEIDGVTVVHIDTHALPEDAHGPIIRIYLNDEPVFENPRYSSD